MIYPHWRGLSKSQRHKAIQFFNELQKAGNTYDYSVRIAGNKARGQTTKEARGYHKAERYRKRGTAYKPAPKSRLDKKKEEWAVYSYFTSLSREGSTDSEILGMTSYDITKTALKNWDSKGQDELFAMHGYMEREFAKYFAMVEGTDFDRANKKDFNYEQDNDSQKNRKHRAFKWQLTDFVSEDIRYQIHYEKGQIIMRDMWEGFDFMQFKLEIREQRKWE